MFFPHVKNLSLIYGHYRRIIDVFFDPILIENLVCFFKCSLNFRAHALQSELNKDEYTNFLGSDCRAWGLKLSEHLKKRTNNFFVFILQIPTLGSFFRTFSFTFFFIFHILNLHKIYVMNTIFHLSKTVIKVVKYLI